MADGRDIKVMVVDDSVIYRKLVGDIVNELPGVKLVGTASNGQTALFRLSSLKPDLLILDIEMPVLNGLQVLATIRDESLPVRAKPQHTSSTGIPVPLKLEQLLATMRVPKTYGVVQT